MKNKVIVIITLSVSSISSVHGMDIIKEGIKKSALFKKNYFNFKKNYESSCVISPRALAVLKIKDDTLEVKKDKKTYAVDFLRI